MEPDTKAGGNNEDVVVDKLWRDVEKAVKAADAAPQCLPGRDGDVEELASDSDSGSGSDMGIHDAAGLPVGPACPSQSEPEAQRSEDWVIVTRTHRPLAARESVGPGGAVHFAPWSTWHGQKEKDIVAGLPPRERALMWYSRIFGGDALTNTELDEESLRPYVEFVFDEFRGTLWPLREDDIAESLRDAPPEALRDISCGEFFAQYHRLRCWLGAMRTSPFGREVLSLSWCRVAKHGCASGLWQKGCWVDVASVVEATDHTYIPATGASVHVNGAGLLHSAGGGDAGVQHALAQVHHEYTLRGNTRIAVVTRRQGVPPVYLVGCTVREYCGVRW